MKSTILVAASLSVASVACSFAARSPEMYRDEVKVALEKKNADIQACYDGVLKGTPGVQGKVTIKFDVETEKGQVTNVSLDAANTTAPPAVAECVTKNVGGVAIAPPDARKGEASWVYEFAAPPPPAPAPAPKS